MRLFKALDVTNLLLPGGLIALLLFLYGKSVEECIAMFDVLAKRAFAPHVFQTSLFPRIFRDGKYNIAPLEQCLDEAYGRTQKMHDCPPTKRSGTKVAVTVTTTSDATLCLFSNYNANAERAGMFNFPQQSSLSDLAQATNTSILQIQDMMSLSVMRT